MALVYGNSIKYTAALATIRNNTVSEDNFSPLARAQYSKNKNKISALELDKTNLNLYNHKLHRVGDAYASLTATVDLLMTKAQADSAAAAVAGAGDVGKSSTKQEVAKIFYSDIYLASFDKFKIFDADIKNPDNLKTTLSNGEEVKIVFAGDVALETIKTLGIDADPHNSLADGTAYRDALVLGRGYLQDNMELLELKAYVEADRREAQANSNYDATLSEINSAVEPSENGDKLADYIAGSDTKNRVQCEINNARLRTLEKRVNLIFVGA